MNPKDHKCPFLNKTCIGDKCAMWVQSEFRNIQSGETTRQDGCGLAKLAELLCAGNQRVFAVQQATESFRNEVVKQNQMAISDITKRLKVVHNHKLLEDTNDNT